MAGSDENALRRRDDTGILATSRTLDEMKGGAAEAGLRYTGKYLDYGHAHVYSPPFVAAALLWSILTERT